MAALTFYFDRTFGKRLPGALNQLGPPMKIEWHQKQKFAQNMPDDQWMSVVGPRGWVVISQDRKFHVNKNELQAIKQHNIKCFYFPCASDPLWESLGYFVRRHKKMMDIASSKAAPFIFDLKKNGQFYKVSL